MTQIIDLGKLRFSFAGEWSNTTIYGINDVVKYGGNVYVYTYSLKESGVLPTVATHWALMVEGFKFKGVYSTGTPYRVGDTVAHGGKVYVSVLDSSNITPPNTTYWSQFIDGVQYEGVYSTTTHYQKNDMVVYGGSLYIAKQDTTGNLPSQTVYWTKTVEGISPKGVYNSATNYVFGDLVAYGNTIYRAKEDVTNVIPTVATSWDVFTSGYGFKGPHENTTTYYVNDVVSYGGNTYLCTLQHASTNFSIDLAADYWIKFNSGIRWRGNWTANTEYLPDDVVTDGVSTLIAKFAFTSGGLSLEDDGVSPSFGAVWEYLAKGASGIPLSDSSTTGKVLSSSGTDPVWKPYTLRTLFVATQF